MQIEDFLAVEQEKRRKKLANIKKIVKAIGYLMLLFSVFLSAIIVFRLKTIIDPEIFPKLITLTLLISIIPTIIYIALKKNIHRSQIQWMAPIFIMLAITLVFHFMNK